MTQSFYTWATSGQGALVLVLVTLNIYTFFAFGWDKHKSKKKGAWRTPEKTLLTLAALGGSIGAYAGMKIWHHKTLHKKFSIGLPCILVVHLGLVVWMVLSSWKKI